MTTQRTDQAFDPRMIDLIVTRSPAIPSSTFQFTYARDYFNACAQCIDAGGEKVHDPDGLLCRFEEVFLALRSRIQNLSGDLTTRIDTLDGTHALSQNVVSLGVLAGQSAQARRLRTLGNIQLRVLWMFVQTQAPAEPALLSEGKLHEVKTALIRLAGLMSAASRAAEEYDASVRETLIVDGFYDPRRVSAQRVREMVEDALSEIRGAELPEAIRTALQKSLESAADDLNRTGTPWSTVISRVT